MPELHAMKKIIHILITSKFYLKLSLRERYNLLKLIRQSFPFPV
ncbi:MAG TPA: hypothetical protein VGJ94_08045 [Syntrophorhabdaceae bacterium]